jgi:YlmC/YmxH family sporulation protein
MRISEMRGKEVIDSNKGQNLGVLGNCDFIFNEDSGQLDLLIIPLNNWFARKKGRESEIKIPWSKIQKIGEETILLDPNHIS